MSATMISLIRAASQNVEAVAAHEGHSPDWLAGFRACLAGLEQADQDDTPATPEEIATAIELFGAEDIEIDSDAQASHGDDGTWVSAWVLIPNDEDEEEDE